MGTPARGLGARLRDRRSAGVRRVGFREFDYPYLTAMIRPENARSIRVAERLGMRPLREDLLFDIPVVVHSVDRATFSNS